MDLIEHADHLDEHQNWAFACDAAARTAPKLNLGPHGAAAVTAIVEALRARTDITAVKDALEAFYAAVDADGTGNASWATGIEAWNQIIHCGIHEQWSGTTALTATSCGDTGDDQWASLAELEGIPADIRELWVTLATDWPGTSEELTEACQAATRSPADAR